MAKVSPASYQASFMGPKSVYRNMACGYLEENRVLPANEVIEDGRVHHLIFDKGAKTIQWKKDSIFSNMVLAQLAFIM